jgi:hypothetical protein
MTQSGHGDCVAKCPLLADVVWGVSATGTKNQLIGSLQQNGDATRLELVSQFVATE